MLHSVYFFSVVLDVTSSHGSNTLSGGNASTPFVYSVFLQFESATVATSLLLDGSANLNFSVLRPLFWIGTQKRAVPGPPVPGLGVKEPFARASANVV